MQPIINDKLGAAFGVTILLSCLIVLVMLPFVGMGDAVWVACLPFMGLMVVKDVWRDAVKAGWGWGLCCSRGRLRQKKGRKGEREAVPAEERFGSTEEMVQRKDDDDDKQDRDYLNRMGKAVVMSSSSFQMDDVEEERGVKEQGDMVAVVSADMDASSNTDVNHERRMQPQSQVLRRTVQSDSSASVQQQTQHRNPNSPTNDLPVLARLQHRFPTLTQVLQRIPWQLGPFCIGMFILVEALHFRGWTSLIAKGMDISISKIVEAIMGGPPTTIIGVGQDGMPQVPQVWMDTYIWVTIFITGFVTTAACNLVNNLPMTILFVRVLQHRNFLATFTASFLSPSFSSSSSSSSSPSLVLSLTNGTDSDRPIGVGASEDPSFRVRRAAMFALVVGSNLGANVLFLGSLAGLMWNKILVKAGPTDGKRGRKHQDSDGDGIFGRGENAEEDEKVPEMVQIGSPFQHTEEGREKIRSDGGQEEMVQTGTRGSTHSGGTNEEEVWAKGGTKTQTEVLAEKRRPEQRKAEEKLLKSRGYAIPQLWFFLYCMAVTPLVLTAACAMLACEMTFFGWE